MWIFVPYLFLISVLSIICPPVFALDHIIFYTTHEKKNPEMDAAKRYLEKKGLKVSIYTGANNLERHIENINKMNKEKARMLIDLNIEITDGEGCFIAVSNARKTSGIFQMIEDIPGVHMENSRELASSIASIFNVKVKELPLFPLIGADMPGIFVYITTKKDGMNIALDKLYMGIENYLKRGKKYER